MSLTTTFVWQTMLGALRLYADNLLCMDLCGWSGADAIRLLGEEVRLYLSQTSDVLGFANGLQY